MKKKDFESLLKFLLNVLPMNVAVKPDHLDELKAFHCILQKTDKYVAKCNEDTEYVLKTLVARGRRFKCLHLITPTSRGLMPLTKTKLMAEVFPTKVKPKSDRAAVIAAMREAVKPQIEDFRTSYKTLVDELTKAGDTEEARRLSICPITNKLLCTKTHVDHYPEPFIKIADCWLNDCTKYKYFKEVPYVTVKGGATKLAEPYLQSWIDYHLKHATLRIVGAKANMKQGSSGYRSRH